MKNKLICSLIIASLASPALASRALPEFRVTALAEKRNAVLTIDGGAVSAIGGGNEVNGILASTRDFKGQPLQAFVMLADSVPTETIDDLAEFQGRIAGTLQCKRIRMGSSPDIPQVKTAVLAENCVIKQLNR